MRIVLKTRQREKVQGLVLPVVEQSAKKAKGKSKKTVPAAILSTTARSLIDKSLEKALQEHLRRFEFVPKNGKRISLLDATSTLRLLRVATLSKDGYQGKAAALDEWRKLAADAVKQAEQERLSEVAVSLLDVPAAELPSVVQAVVEGLRLATYRYESFKGATRSTKKPSVQEVQLLVSTVSKAVHETIALGEIISQAVMLARDLVNCPPSDLPPQKIAQEARKIAAKRGSGIRLKVYDRRALQRMKANALLGVSRGSDVPPYLLHLSYKPTRRAKDSKIIAFVGKGVTFDSGGLSIKTGKGMEDMKCDMAGAASVLGLMHVLASLKPADRPKHEIHVVIPTCENMINGQSMKPGDVVFAMNGKSIEVLNTDAEGRLILADALSYVSKLKPDYLVDVATLTGACIVALGDDISGVFSNEETFSEQIVRLGKESGEQFWPLPLADCYRDLIKSNVADVKNIGPGGPGATIGALFLQEFVPAETTWAHLDIAGPAFTTKQSDYVAKGGTGTPVRTLVRMLQNLSHER